MKKLVIGDICSRAWDLAVKHWLVFVIISLVSALIGVGIQHFSNPNLPVDFGQNPDPKVLVELYKSLFFDPFFILSCFISWYFSLVVYRMAVNVLRTGKPYASLSEVFNVGLKRYFVFACVSLIYLILVFTGSILCILPGIFLCVRLTFVPLAVAADNVGFGEAFSRSWNMTKGNFWNLFLLGLTAIGIALLGFCACCVGVFFAAVIVNFMLALAYFELKDDDQPENMEEAVEVVEP